MQEANLISYDEMTGGQILISQIIKVKDAIIQNGLSDKPDASVQMNLFMQLLTYEVVLNRFTPEAQKALKSMMDTYFEEFLQRVRTQMPEKEFAYYCKLAWSIEQFFLPVRRELIGFYVHSYYKADFLSFYSFAVIFYRGYVFSLTTFSDMEVF